MYVKAKSAIQSKYAPGWDEVQKLTTRPRMIAIIRGEDGDGKTKLGLTAPGPIAVFPFDNNTKEIIEKARRFKKIVVPTEPLEYADAADQDNIEALWLRFKTLYLEAINSTSIRTIMIDTATDLYELARLAILGRLEQVPAIHYGKVNVQFHDLIKKVHPTDKNLILVHRLKDEYIKSGKDSARTGKRIISGVADIRYKVQLNLLCWRDVDGRDEEQGTEGFGFTIDKCTQNEALVGTFLAEPNNTWKDLGMLVYPESSESDWE